MTLSITTLAPIAFILSAVMLNAVMLNVVMLNVVVLNVIVLNVVMMNVVMLTVVTPCGLYYKSFTIVIYDINDSTIVEPLL